MTSGNHLFANLTDGWSLDGLESFNPDWQNRILVLSIFRRLAMRSLMSKHAAKITAINPSAARFAHEEMPGFMLVRISVLSNILSARDLHSSLFNFRVSHCVSLRVASNTRSTC